MFTFCTYLACAPASYVGHYGKRHDTPLGIMRTNVLPLGSDAREGGLFLATSRLNHSCRNSAQHTWNEKIGCITIHAIQDIEEGQESLITSIVTTRATNPTKSASTAWARYLAKWPLALKILAVSSSPNSSPPLSLAKSLAKASSTAAQTFWRRLPQRTPQCCSPTALAIIKGPGVVQECLQPYLHAGTATWAEGAAAGYGDGVLEIVVFAGWV